MCDDPRSLFPEMGSWSCCKKGFKNGHNKQLSFKSFTRKQWSLFMYREMNIHQVGIGFKGNRWGLLGVQACSTLTPGREVFGFIWFSKLSWHMGRCDFYYGDKYIMYSRVKFGSTSPYWSQPVVTSLFCIFLLPTSHEDSLHRMYRM